MSRDHLLVDNLAISPGTPLMRVIEIMSSVDDKILLVLDDERRLLGVVTDYDIRHAILRHFNFDRPVADFMSAHPVVAASSMSDTEVAELMRSTSCASIPVVDSDGRAVDVRFLREFVHFAANQESKVAVVMAGGFGSRLRPLTETTPKPLLRIGGKPILFTLLDQIINEGFDKIYLTLHYRSDDIIYAVNQVWRYRDRVTFLVESEPTGTAGALGHLIERPRYPFLVINADVLTEVPMRELLRYHVIEGNAITIASKLESYDVPYGVIEVEGGRVVGIREKPSYKMFVNTGVYIVEPSVLDLVTPGEGIDMPTLIQRLINDGKRIGSFPVHEYWIDIGTHAQYQRAQEEFGQRFVDPKDGR